MYDGHDEYIKADEQGGDEGEMMGPARKKDAGDEHYPFGFGKDRSVKGCTHAQGDKKQGEGVHPDLGAIVKHPGSAGKAQAENDADHISQFFSYDSGRKNEAAGHGKD